MSRRPFHRKARRPLFLTRLEDRTAPAVATWDGGGADNKWTTPSNWVGDVAPQPGDDLVFPAGAPQQTNVNDFPSATAFGSVAVTAGGYQISGNALEVTAGVAANIPFGTSTLTVAVAGTGGLTMAGAGTFVLGGNNSYAGVTTVNAGILDVRADTALGAIGAGNETSVADGATLLLGGTGLTIAEPIAFTGPGMPGGRPTRGAIQNLGSNTLTGLLTLTGNSMIYGENPLTITTGIGETGGPRDLLLLALGELTFTATAVNTYTGTTTVWGDVRYHGWGVGPLVVPGFLRGTGTIGPWRFSSTNGRVFPGDSSRFNSDQVPGTLTVSDVDLSAGTTQIVLGGPSFSQLVARGTVRLGGKLSVSLLATPLTQAQYRLKVGDSFTIVDNDGTDPVDGTFAGLPEGALITHGSPQIISPRLVLDWIDHPGFVSLGPVPLRISYHGGDGNDVVLTAVSQAAFAVGAGPGDLPRVNVYDGSDNLIRSFLAYDAGFRGGVRVATTDITRDGVPDVITAPGPGGGPHIRVFDGATSALVREFMAYDPAFRGGVSIAAARINTADHVPDIITGAGAGGGPHVKVFDGATGAVMGSFMAYDPGFRGGVSVAGLDWTIHHATRPVDSEHLVPGNVVTGAGPGGGAHVKIFWIPENGAQPFSTEDFIAYDPAFRGGVNVAAYRTIGNDNSVFSIVTAPASGAAPTIRSFDIVTRLGSFFPPPTNPYQSRGEFLAYDAAFRGGVTLAVLPLGNNGMLDIVTGPGPGGGPHLRQWTPRLVPNFDEVETVASEFFAFAPSFSGGVFVG